MKIEVRMDSSLVEGAFGFHVEVRVKDAASEIEALDATTRTMRMLATGRRTFIRANPESSHYRDFDTKVTEYRGYARFIVLDQEGEWEELSPHLQIPPIGHCIGQPYITRT